MNDEVNMIYAPVLIPTLCRYEHFVRCIESLKQNTWAKYTDVYIGLDYPKKQCHWEGYNKICKYLKKNFSEFKSFNVIKRTENYGSYRNMLDLREYIFKNYDRFIRTDDDAEFSPNFLEYINKCLMHYENNENIIGVTGYSYPLEWLVDSESNVFEEDFICPMWGTGFWREKYREFEEQLTKGHLRKNFNKYLSNIEKNRLTDARFIDYINGVLCWSDNNLIEVVSDISVGIYLTVEKKRIVMPTISKVRNHGFDGTGQYCQNIVKEDNYSEHICASNYNYSQQYIDDERCFHLIPSAKNNLEENKTLMNDFDIRSYNSIKKAKLKALVYKLFGKTIYKKVWILKNKKKAI